MPMQLITLGPTPWRAQHHLTRWVMALLTMPFLKIATSSLTLYCRSLFVDALLTVHVYEEHDLCLKEIIKALVDLRNGFSQFCPYSFNMQ